MMPSRDLTHRLSALGGGDTTLHVIFRFVTEGSKTEERASQFIQRPAPAYFSCVHDSSICSACVDSLSKFAHRFNAYSM